MLTVKKYADPTKYGKLVEKGHGGPHPAKAYPFLVPALNEVQRGFNGDAGEKILRGIERMAKK